MKKHFYSDIVSNEGLQLELDGLDLEDYEKEELLTMVDANLHHAILEAILDELSEDDKQLFLEHIGHGNHDKVWEHLRGRIENIESKIQTTANSLMEELYKDIKAVKDEESENS
jgi:hypothetical protein